MIKVHLSRLLGERKMKQSDLCRQTGISKMAVSELYNERTKRIHFDTIEKICKALGCSVGDLLEYVPDE